MRAFFIKTIALLLLIATLFPLVIACKDDDVPPPDDDDSDETEETNMDNYYFKLNVDSKADSTLIDFTDPAFVNATDKVKNNIATVDGKTVLKWDMFTGGFEAPLPETRSLKYCTSIRFSVYSEAATDSVFEIKLMNTKKTGGYWSTAIRIVLDFEGWKHFDIPSNQTSGYGARDDSVVAIQFSESKTSEGKQPTDVIYITNIDITTESYSVTAPAGVDVNDASLYTGITANARKMLIGDASMVDTDIYKSKLAGTNSSCKKALNLYREYKAEYPDSDVESKLFGVVVEKVYWEGEVATNTFYSYICDLAKGYAMQGSDYYQNEEVLQAILYSLEYGYKFYFGPSLLEYGMYGNWAHWELTLPVYLINTLIYIEDKISSADCEKYLSVYDYLVPYPKGKGGNKIRVARHCVLSAALRRDALDLCIATEYMNDLFVYIDDYMQEGGFFEDGSFIQHYYYGYITAYGEDYFSSDGLPGMLYWLYGSRFYPTQDNVNNHIEWAISSLRPVMHGKYVMNALGGRTVGQLDRTESASNYASGLVMMYYYASDEYKAKLEPMLAEYMQLYGNDMVNIVPLYMVNYTKELYERFKDIAVAPYENNKVFGMMSRTVHHAPEYAVCLSYSNQNIGKYEAINNENRCGWYHGDGMIQIYTGDYTFDRNFYFFANPYRLPGVTANSAERKKELFYNALHNASNYAGGVSQGKYGTTGFILDYYEDGITVTNTTFYNDKDASIYAKKSYFFFDNEVVCVGSDISDKSGTNVLTTIENRYWRDGDILTEINNRVLHFTGMGGYVLLPYSGESYDGAALNYQKVSNSYNGMIEYDELPSVLQGTKSFLEIYLDHGVGNSVTGAIENNKYFYAYLPEATAEQTSAYYADTNVELLARNSRVHSVIEKKLGIVACNFFEEGGTVTVSAGKYGEFTGVRSISTETLCSVMITRNADGSYTVSASDPTQTYRNTVFSVKIDGITSVVSADNGVNATVENGVISVVINSENALGQTFSFTVK